MKTSTVLHPKEAILPAGLPEPMGYSHAVRAGDFLFPSGLMATDFINGIVPEARIKPGRPLDVHPVKQQTRYIYKTLKRVMEAGGSSLSILSVSINSRSTARARPTIWRVVTNSC